MRNGLSLLLIMLIALFPLGASAAGNWYYGSGNYVSSAPIKPVTGLKFYVDYSAVTTYGGGSFTTAFDWNGNYKGNVQSVAQYPASQSSFPGYFLITAHTLPLDYQGQTFYYDSNGNPIDLLYPMDSSSIKYCQISLNSKKSAFEINGSFNQNYLEKVIRHEVGHVFLLKHPSSTNYPASVMHQGTPYNQRSATVTSNDKENIKAKWGQ